MGVLDRLYYDTTGGMYHKCPKTGIAYLIVGSRCGYCGEAIYLSTPLHNCYSLSRYDTPSTFSYTLQSDNINTFRG